MREATEINRVRMEEIARQKAAIPKGLKSKQTVTSLLRREVNKQAMLDYSLNATGSPGQSTVGKGSGIVTTAKRN